jgi:hypothetical protein
MRVEDDGELTFEGEDMVEFALYVANVKKSPYRTVQELFNEWMYKDEFIRDVYPLKQWPLIKEFRRITNATLLETKKALVISEWSVQRAVDYYNELKIKEG